jgi:hypothetical protein
MQWIIIFIDASILLFSISQSVYLHVAGRGGGGGRSLGLFYCEHSKVGLSYLCGKGGNSVKRSIVIFPRKEYHSEHRTAMGVGGGGRGEVRPDFT